MSYNRPQAAPPSQGGYGYPPQGGPPQGGYPQGGSSGPMPPTNQMQHGQGMDFRYSNNQGRRKALLIGINYIGSNNQLNGCINDANAMRRYISQNHGYQQDDIVMLTDDQNNPRCIPTKQNILQAMQWLVAGAQPNDCLFFHYSGHGTSVRDQDGDEEDGYDEAICPVDFQQSGMIIDDIMHDIMVRPLPPGCRLTALFDSCHSGSALDLPFTYSTKGSLKEQNSYMDAGKGAFSAVLDYERGDLIGAFSSLKNAATRLATGNNVAERNRQTKSSPADVISFSGCKDDQTSADAAQGSTQAGAMSYSFLEVMSRYPNQTYISLLNNVRDVMMSRFSQKPQLSCSHPLDLNYQFLL